MVVVLVVLVLALVCCMWTGDTTPPGPVPHCEEHLGGSDARQEPSLLPIVQAGLLPMRLYPMLAIDLSLCQHVAIPTS